MVDGAEARFGDRVAFVRLDAAERANQAFLDAVRLTGHPSVFVFDARGALSTTFLGPVSADRLEAAIAAVLPGNGP